MPRRPASVTQADIARAIRAMQAAGFEAVHVAFRDGAVIVEQAPKASPDRQSTDEELADDDEVVVL